MKIFSSQRIARLTEQKISPGQSANWIQEKQTNEHKLKKGPQGNKFFRDNKACRGEDGHIEVNAGQFLYGHWTHLCNKIMTVESQLCLKLLLSTVSHYRLKSL